MPIRYRNGLRMKVPCHQCGTKVMATIYQQRIRWIARLECPHAKKHMGYTMPLEELKNKQLVSTDNSRNDAAVKASQERARQEMAAREAETIRDNKDNWRTRPRFL